VAGQPCPICISTSGAIDEVPPLSAMSLSSSSAIVLQWTYVVRSESRPDSFRIWMGLIFPQCPSPT